jgi:parallel beta-helix repeat protein
LSVCARANRVADLNYDNYVDGRDLAFFAEQWLQEINEPAQASFGVYNYFVAASDCPSNIKAKADFVCDGKADQEQINQAIESIYQADCRGTVYLARGTYYINKPISMRHGVSLITDSCNHGTTLHISSNSNCHGIEFSAAGYNTTGTGAARIEGIYVEGNGQNQIAGCGFYIPKKSVCVTYAGSALNATVQVTSTQIVLREDGNIVYAANLSDEVGSLVSLCEDGNIPSYWQIYDITGYYGTEINCNCKSASSFLIQQQAETYCKNRNIELYAKRPYDFYFNRCMALHTKDSGFFLGTGHSTHLDECVSEYSYLGDGFRIDCISNLRAYGCYSACNALNGYSISSPFANITGCLASKNKLNGFEISRYNAMLIGCISHLHTEPDSYGIYLSYADNTIINGCDVYGNTGTIYQEDSDGVVISGCSIRD